MKNKPQKYATVIFKSLVSAEGFKKELGDRCLQTIKQDKLGNYKVRFLIDKSRPLVDRSMRNKYFVHTPDFEEHWKF
jgi:hypothetical protein